MKSQRYGIFTVMAIASLMLQSCGNGGGSPPVLSVSASSVAAGQPLTATAQLSSSNGVPLNKVTVTYVSDAKDVIPDATGSTDSTGLSTVALSTKNIKNTATVVTIYALAGGVQSNSVQVTVTPATLTFTPPADATFAQTADATTKLCSGGQMRVVPSGAQVLFKDPSGQNVFGQQVAISVTSITNILLPLGIDQVVFYPGALNTVTIPPFTASVSLTTDTSGTALLPVAIDGYFPTNQGGQHVFVINWQASTQVVGNSGVTIPYVVTKQTSITTSCN